MDILSNRKVGEEVILLRYQLMNLMKYPSTQMDSYLKKYNYQGTMYFDTFPKREEAVAECEMNLKMCKKIETLVDRLGVERIGEVIEKCDGTEVMKLFLETI